MTKLRATLLIFYNIDMDWYTFINKETQQDYYKKLEDFINNEAKSHVIFPERTNMFNCFKYAEPKDIRVVIVGQDPYYTPGYANGLAFAVNQGVQLPKSLINIFKELEDDLGIHKTNSDLKDWAKQGVLLLNRVMTVNKDQPNSHKNKGWEIFTTKVIKFLNNDFDNIVFILWGNNAQELIPYIDPSRHLIIKSSHPSPLGYYKSFKGSKPFSKTNNYLKSHNKKKINW